MDNNLVHTHIDSDGKEYTHSHTHTHTQTKAVINRLSKISGHVESIKRILTQLAAVKAAVSAVSSIVLKDHIEHCIVDAARENDKEAIADLIKSIDRFVK